GGLGVGVPKRAGHPPLKEPLFKVPPTRMLYMLVKTLGSPAIRWTEYMPFGTAIPHQPLGLLVDCICPKLSCNSSGDEELFRSYMLAVLSWFQPKVWPLAR